MYKGPNSLFTDMQKYMVGAALLVFLALAFGTNAFAQTATDAETRSDLGGALGALDGTLDVTATKEAQGTISSEPAVENTLEGIESTLLRIRGLLTEGGSTTNTIPTGFPNTGHHPGM